jgi:DNA-binding transcriptional LysR family regulator
MALIAPRIKDSNRGAAGKADSRIRRASGRRDHRCGAHSPRRQCVKLIKSYRSEREDWILTMVAAGLGVCFLPEHTAVFPGVIGCPVTAPSVARSVCVVTVAGRRQAPPLKAFINAVQRYPWPTQTVTR